MQLIIDVSQIFKIIYINLIQYSRKSCTKKSIQRFIDIVIKTEQFRLQLSFLQCTLGAPKPQFMTHLSQHNYGSA